MAVGGLSKACYLWASALPFFLLMQCASDSVSVRNIRVMKNVKESPCQIPGGVLEPQQPGS